MVQLTEDLVEVLDREAAERGVSRSAVIREAIEEHLAHSREQLIGHQIVEGYTRIPPATPDEWGDPEAMLDASVRELMARLDLEERGSGMEAW
jgi:Arc/MetJ-type ribon-helix-helix transcriptional regulator